MDFRSEFAVQPGSDLKLDKIDPGYRGPHASEDEAKGDTDRYRETISRLQRTLYGDRSKALLFVLQGIDGAGKDGTCWHVISAMDPQGAKVTGFKQPTPEEQAHDVLWRVHPHAPARPAAISSSSLTSATRVSSTGWFWRTTCVTPGGI
jgi:polyphosphate kinase 2 (PPK2 family)